MENKFILFSLSKDELQLLIKDAVENAIKNNGINNSKPKELLSAKEAAELLGCSRSFLYTKNFPRKKLGKRVFYLRNDIENFIKNETSESNLE